MAEAVKAVLDDARLYAGGSSLDSLLPALQRLDRLLQRAVAAAQAAYGSAAAGDPFRGLHVGDDEVERLLAREPGAPALWAVGNEFEAPLPDAVADRSPLAWLAAAFDLAPFEVDLILIALAPEFDLRYERLYAYLQDDVTRRWPSVDLALNLLCRSAEAKLARRAHFGADAPLIRHGLLQLIPDPHQLQPPRLAHYLKLDEQIVRLLLAQRTLDSRLAPFCRMVEPAVSLDELPLDAERTRALPALLSQARESGQPLRLYFHGPRGAGKRRAAEALAGAVGARLLAVGLARIPAADADLEHVLKLLFREAWFQDAVLYLDDLDALRGDERGASYQRVLAALAEDAGITILAGAQPWAPAGHGPMGVIVMPFRIPDFAGRRACWQTSLAAHGVALAPDALAGLADRFRLTPEQIGDATATVCNYARWRAAGAPLADPPSHSSDRPTIRDLFSAARAQASHDLGTLARKTEPVYTWDDIVLPDESLAQLRELCSWVAHRHRVLGDWGFGRKLSHGKGVNALFSGPSGTGKTMAADIIANELGLDLYRIDLSGIVSKYIGETEKNLARIFSAAEDANAILFFDEADALFGKRSEVRDSHDRYANIEISYLLQQMEQYEGLAILATNLRQNMDEAFVRRLAFVIEFAFPDEASRRRIWVGSWPASTPLAADVDLELMARQFKLSGGNIKNVALAAAFQASASGGPVTMAHLLRATAREHQKLGKVLSAAELNSPAGDGRARYLPSEAAPTREGS
jgi:AAA+ superfamily predicted ATPase